MIKSSQDLVRYNPVGVQLLPRYLYEYLFGEESFNETYSEETVIKSIKHLQDHGIRPNAVNQAPIVLPARLPLPKLRGKDVREHLYNIAHDQVKGYRLLIDQLINTAIDHRPPSEWAYSPGWTRYSQDGRTHKTVAYPEEDAMVLDVEVCSSVDSLPVVATVTSPNGWYSWVSPKLYYERDYATSDATPTDLIPVGPSPSQRLIVAHHASYDRARLREEYIIKGDKMRFLDTLSLHVCIAGQTTLQKGIWRKKQGLDSSNHSNSSVPGRSGRKSSWLTVSSPNSLEDVYQLYYGRSLDKTPRSVFVKGDLADVRENFQSLMAYCGTDVACTLQLLTKIYPLFCGRFPHPATLSGMLEMGSAYLPVNKSWKKYIDSANYVAKELDNELDVKLMELAEGAASFDNQNDMWLSKLDWDCKKLRRKGKSEKVMGKLLADLPSDQTTEQITISSNRKKKEIVHLPGYPNWYRTLCERRSAFPWKPGPTGVSPQTRITPYLLKMKWDNTPLYHHSTKGWGYLIPIDTPLSDNNIHWSIECDIDPEVIATSKIFSDDESTAVTSDTGTHVTVNGQQYLFYKLPHKSGPQANCGNPLSKDYLPRMEEQVLTSQAGMDGQRILTINSMISSWRGVKSRIEEQFVVWSDEKEGVILPLIMSAGTATRRGVEKTWLTASNAKEFRVGSELKGMVQAPKGYNIVGADVDSQELWIASLLGDSYFTGMHGCTALSWMTLQGNKTDGTDLHSKTAATIGITRDQAKVFNYGRMYGAGKRFAKLLLRQFNPTLEHDMVEQKADSLYKATKGERRVVLAKTAQAKAREAGVDVWTDGSLDQDQYYSLFRYERAGKARRRYWYGGMESHMFNKLEQVAKALEPVTPVLKCRMSQALEPKHVGTDFMTSRGNWVVQSSAVDYLHLLLVSMRWLMEEYNINGRLCLSIHDEVRYLVESSDAHKAAMALQLSNLFTRALFSLEIGIPDLPMSVAFFSSIDIDSVMRKEVNLDCKTPSNPLGLKDGYNIPYGQSLDIIQLLEHLKSTNKNME